MHFSSKCNAVAFLVIVECNLMRGVVISCRLAGLLLLLSLHLWAHFGHTSRPHPHPHQQTRTLVHTNPINGATESSGAAWFAPQGHRKLLQSSPPPPSPSPTNVQIVVEDAPSTGAIVGGVVGGLAGLTLMLAAALLFAAGSIKQWWCCARWQELGGGRRGGGSHLAGTASTAGATWAATPLQSPTSDLEGCGASLASGTPSFTSARSGRSDVWGLVALGNPRTAPPSKVPYSEMGAAMTMGTLGGAAGTPGPRSAPAATAAGMGGGSRRASTEAAAEWRECLIDPAKVLILRRPNGQLWRLGGGSFGQVYKALYDDVQVVAVKVLAGMSDPGQLEAFLREGRILRDCRDPNIVQFVGAACDPTTDQALLVTEFMEAGDLWRALRWRDEKGQRVFGWYSRGAKAALDAARGLHYLHSHHVIHLDLKSANILLSRDGTAKLADVGLARTSLTKNYLSMVHTPGTFAWSAPEVLTGQKCDEKADIFSYGVVLWEICTGELPSRGTMRNVEVPGECTAAVRDLIDACMSTDPKERPTAKQIVVALEQAGAGGVKASRGRGGLRRSSSGGRGGKGPISVVGLDRGQPQHASPFGAAQAAALEDGAQGMEQGGLGSWREGATISELSEEISGRVTWHPSALSAHLTPASSEGAGRLSKATSASMEASEGAQQGAQQAAQQAEQQEQGAGAAAAGQPGEVLAAPGVVTAQRGASLALMEASGFASAFAQSAGWSSSSSEPDLETVREGDEQADAGPAPAPPSAAAGTSTASQPERLPTLSPAAPGVPPGGVTVTAERGASLALMEASGFASAFAQSAGWSSSSSEPDLEAVREGRGEEGEGQQPAAEGQVGLPRQGSEMEGKDGSGALPTSGPVG